MTTDADANTEGDGADRRPDICILTKVQYTDTAVRAEHGTLVRTAQWLQDAVDRDAGGPGARIENPLANLLDDERRQTVVPERRPRLLELMDRMADGHAETPRRDGRD